MSDQIFVPLPTGTMDLMAAVLSGLASALQ